MNKKIKPEVAFSIVILLSVVLGGIFWIGNKQDENSQQVSRVGLSQQAQPLIEYKIIDVKNPQIKFSFEVPKNWNVETRNSGEKKLSIEDKRDFLIDYSERYDEYIDDKDFYNMTEKEVIENFAFGAIASVENSSRRISYTDTSWGQIDFDIINSAEADKAIREARSSKDYSGIYYDKSGKTNIIGKPTVKDLKIANYDATSITYPTDIDENGKELITKAGTGGQDIYITIGTTGKILNIHKQAKGDGQFEKDFEHLIQTLKIEK